jgi:hypothetical protein
MSTGRPPDRQAGSSALLRLYPRGWRARYGAEFAEFLDQVRGEQSRARVTWDILRGAVDAHLSGRYGMQRFWSDPALRRGVYDGLLIAAFAAVVIVVSNVVLPPDPSESDSDPEYVMQYLILLAVLGLMLVAVGVRGGRRTGSLAGGVRAGAVAGVLLALLVTLTFIVVNNLFLSVVSQQHDKRLNFAASGWSSMRAYLTVTQLESLVILLPVAAVAGAGAGLVGAAAARYLRRSRSTVE